MADLLVNTAVEIAKAVRSGDRSPVAILDSYLDRIEARNDRTNAFVTVTDSRARDRARAVERTVSEGGDPGPLAGVPIGIKDLCPIAGVPTTYGSRPFAGHVADRTAILVDRLEDAGAVVVGKTNACEFGHKGTTDNGLHGPTTTPFRDDRNAGGSSGGSAAAVADGLVPLAQGGDGGGSIRIPAALCGVYGFKPSYGRVPFGARPNAFGEHTPFVHRGPLSRTVADAALFLDVVAGPHAADPFSLPHDGSEYRAAVGRDIDGLTVGYSRDFGGFPVEDAVESEVRDAVFSLGADVETVDIDFGHDREEVLGAWRTGFEVLNAAIAEDLEGEHDVDVCGEHRDEMSDEFVDLVEAGRKRSALELERADRIRTDVYDEIRKTLERYDVLATPTLATAAIQNDGGDTVGPATVTGERVDPLIGWALTYPVNLTGHPAASVPAGYIDDETPVGIQLVGPRHDDETVLAVSSDLERERPWVDSLPT